MPRSPRRGPGKGNVGRVLGEARRRHDNPRQPQAGQPEPL